MSSELLRGIVETRYDRNVFIRDLDQWGRWFGYVTDCAGQRLPEQGAIVTFTPDPHYPRGPRAVDVVEVQAPAADVHRRCADCGNTFTLTANDRAWFAVKRYTPPMRCKACRLARRAGAPATAGVT